MDPNNDLTVQYMVEFDVPQPFTEELMSMVPAQRDSIDSLFSSGKLLSYTVAADKSKVWAVMMAESESELLSYIDELPLTPYMDFDYCKLMFYNTVHFMPAMSLN